MKNKPHTELPASGSRWDRFNEFHWITGSVDGFNTVQCASGEGLLVHWNGKVKPDARRLYPQHGFSIVSTMELPRDLTLHVPGVPEQVMTSRMLSTEVFHGRQEAQHLIIDHDTKRAVRLNRGSGLKEHYMMRQGVPTRWAKHAEVLVWWGGHNMPPVGSFPIRTVRPVPVTRADAQHCNEMRAAAQMYLHVQGCTLGRAGTPIDFATYRCDSYPWTKQWGIPATRILGVRREPFRAAPLPANLLLRCHDVTTLHEMELLALAFLGWNREYAGTEYPYLEVAGTWRAGV